MTTDLSLKLLEGFPEYMARQGWEVHVVSAPGPLLNRLQASQDVSTHGLEMEREIRLMRDLGSLLMWFRLLKSIRPDLISAGTPKAGMLGVVAGRFAAVPVRIYHLRGLRLETLSGISRTISTVVERLAVRASTRVLCVSNSLRESALELRLGKRDCFDVVGNGSSNGVDTSRFFCSREQRRGAKLDYWGPNLDSIVVGFVGRLNPDKGLCQLATAVSILSKRGIMGRLLIVGGFDLEKGRDAVSELSAAGWEVEFTGPVEDTSSYYRCMDVLCLPSRREGFPNVILEAAASSLPCVANRVTGVVDAVRDGETGFLVDNESPSEMADRLAELIANECRRIEMGKAAEKMVRDKYERETVWSCLNDYYRSQLDR